MLSKNCFNFNLLTVAVTAAFIFVGCESDQTVSNTGGTTNPATAATATPTPVVLTVPTVTPSPTPIVALSAAYNAELYFTVTSAWDQAPTNPSAWIPTSVDGAPPSVPLPTACMIATGAAPSTGVNPMPTPAALGHTCDFTIPEAQLYYSNLTFSMGSSDSANCAYMVFYPYFYEINGSNNPPNPGATPAPAIIDVPWKLGAAQTTAQCYGYQAGLYYPYDTGVPSTEQAPIYTTTACYNGPATVLVPTFPTSIGLIQETEKSQQLQPAVLPSAFSQNQASNRWASNDIGTYTVSNMTAPTNFLSGEYFSGSMHGYTFQCLNQFGILQYQMKITISPESNSSGATELIYKGWR